MGAVPTWTCAPYQTHMRPAFGQQIAWGESNAISFANSVIGARTERYPDLLDICCAITGRVPAIGLHLAENRGGDICLRLAGVPAELQRDDQFFAVLGHLVGKLADEHIPVIDGIVVSPAEDQLKAFAAAAASSGRVALFHIVGVTPEAPTLEAAFLGRAPARTVTITVADLRAARRELTTADGRELDMVILGSPHFSLAEFGQLAPLVAGRHAHPRVKFLITSSRLMKERAREEGILDPILAFGAQITLDTCILASPMLPPEIRMLMTNSAKYACLRAQPAQRARDVRQPRRLCPLGHRGARRSRRVAVADRVISGRAIVAGEADGEALVTNDALSFWGGYDFHTGEIIDKHHPLAGVRASGRILAVPFSKGSSTTTAVLLEAVRAGTAPAAILTTGTDAFFALASIVADVMYGKPFPVIALEPDDFATLRTGEHLSIESSGVIHRK